MSQAVDTKEREQRQRRLLSVVSDRPGLPFPEGGPLPNERCLISKSDACERRAKFQFVKIGSSLTSFEQNIRDS